MSAPPVSPLTILGDGGQGGAYVLRLAVAEPVAVSFGKFRGGAAIPLPPGEYLYLGSALGQKGASSLARRLLRHATRSGARPPQAIRAEMLARFPAIGLGTASLAAPARKTRHWHIDYLLDDPAVRLAAVVIIRTARPIEGELGRLLAADAGTGIVAAGLGASDVPGGTHLLRVFGGAAWWASLPEIVLGLVK